MQANYVQRLRLTFSKMGPTRYISHLDLARTLERALNRARIPVSYTQGFNRRPRMQIAAALPLGYTSDSELADVWLEEKMEPERVRRQLMAKMAPGITIHQVEEVPLSELALQTRTAEASYVATVLDPVDVTDLQRRIDALLAANSLVRQRGRGRKRKEYDLRPLIYDLRLAATANGLVQIHMRLALMPAETGRPDEVLLALGLDPLAARIHRTGIVLANERVDL
ncbi:MAG TPA: TIGR03936 family radical SAM-associated protein [Anaerolineae bacterium]